MLLDPLGEAFDHGTDDVPPGNSAGSGGNLGGQPARPPIRRVEPHGEVVRPGWEIPVLAQIRWLDGRGTEVLAVATAWTRSATEITWDAPGFGPSTDWIGTEDVRPAKPRRH